MMHFKRRIAAVAVIALFAAVQLMAQGGATIDVVASGVGKDEAEAKADAFRNAVRQAIGSVVSAETLVNKDDVVRDQILTYSDGYVEKYDMVGKPMNTPSGLVSVTIKALVRREKLVEKARSANIVVTEVDGKSLAAQAATRDDKREKAAALIGAELNDIPRGLVKAETVGEPRYDDRAGKLLVDVRVSVDQEAYASFVARLIPKLEEVATKSYVLTPSKHGVLMGRDKEKLLDEVWFPTSQFPAAADDKSLVTVQADDGKTNLVLLCERMNSALNSSRWRLFLVEPEVVEAFAGALAPVAISIELRDGDDKVIDSYDLSLAREKRGPVAARYTYAQTNKNQVLVFPLFASDSAGYGLYYNKDLTIHLRGGRPWFAKQAEFAMKGAGLEKVKKVVCQITSGTAAAR